MLNLFNENRDRQSQRWSWSFPTALPLACIIVLSCVQCNHSPEIHPREVQKNGPEAVISAAAPDASFEDCALHLPAWILQARMKYQAKRVLC